MHYQNISNKNHFGSVSGSLDRLAAASRCLASDANARRIILVLLIYLTRFNKIAIQGTHMMAVDKEAICLSRVYSYYYKYNLPLFYVYPGYLNILFLNILTLLACTHSSDNLLHTLTVLCENENFLTSNLLPGGSEGGCMLL